MISRTHTFPSSLDSVASASSFILNVAQEFEVSEELTQHMLLVIGEAVANAAGHGNEFDPDKRVTVTCLQDGDEVQICVEDEGPGIPAERLEHAALPDDLMQTSGRGLFIMKSLADRIWIEGGGRRLCMVWDQSADRA